MRIYPITGRNHAVGGQRRNQAVHQFLGGQAQFAGAFAVDVDFQGRIIHVLRHQNIADARQHARLLGDLGGDFMRRLHVHAADLNIQRRRHALIENGIHEAACLKISADLRQFTPKPGPDFTHVGKAAELVVVVKSHLHKRRVRGGVGSQDGGKAGSDADVGNNNLEVALGNNLADDLFYLAYDLVRQLQAGAGGSFDVNDKLARVCAGKVGFADERIEAQT